LLQGNDLITIKKLEIMKAYFLIDGRNNNKVVGGFDSKTEINNQIRYYFENDNEEYKKISEFKKYEFKVVSRKEMEQAIVKYGNRVYKYYTGVNL
jgi:hypothetical protein